VLSVYQDEQADELRLSEFYSNEHPLKFVTTQNGEVPTALNSEPLCTITSGRGCLVFFNPASFFYPLTTGYVVEETLATLQICQTKYRSDLYEETLFLFVSVGLVRFED
jgi:hypothetical protein